MAGLNEKLYTLKSDSHLSKNAFFASLKALPKWWKMLFILRARFVLKIFKFLSSLLSQVGKTARLER